MNELYPIFLKVHQLNILIVGGGYVALEKVHFLLKSSPNANISFVSLDFIPEVQEIIERHNFDFKTKAYTKTDIIGKSIVIGTTNFESVNQQIYHDCKSKNILVNVADKPNSCDFYMGGIVTNGNLKLAISTNGKSPTMAKRFRQLFEDILPDSMDEVFFYLNEYRNTLKNDFDYKKEALNNLTKDFVIDKRKKESWFVSNKRKLNNTLKCFFSNAYVSNDL